MFSVRGLRLYFPALETWVASSASLPCHSSQFIYARIWGRGVCQLPHCLPHSFVPQSATSPGPPAKESSPPRLPISAPPTGLDKCFFFISLAVGLPCGLIFCQFWLFFVFKLLSFFWLCEEVQCVYLRLHLGWKLMKQFQSNSSQTSLPGASSS